MSLTMAQLTGDHQEMTCVMFEVWKTVSQEHNIGPTEFTKLFIQVSSDDPEHPMTGEALFKALQSKFPGQLYGIDAKAVANAIVGL